MNSDEVRYFKEEKTMHLNSLFLVSYELTYHTGVELREPSVPFPAFFSRTHKS